MSPMSAGLLCLTCHRHAGGHGPSPYPYSSGIPWVGYAVGYVGSLSDDFFLKKTKKQDRGTTGSRLVRVDASK